MSAGIDDTVPSTDRDSPARSQPHSPSPGAHTKATTQLSEAIDEFLGDVERKFKFMNEEILTKLDDMAERCDKLEAELLVSQTEATKATPSSTNTPS